MNATNQCNSKYFILKTAEAQTQYVLLSQLLLIAIKHYVNIPFLKSTFLQQEIIRSLCFWQFPHSLWPVHFGH